ncbi:MAG: hypothetical protein U9Q74_03680 [Gemmatimonadota bacterium]|nr:hypothetical protein [Gemmatimonadota bacterium]
MTARPPRLTRIVPQSQEAFVRHRPAALAALATAGLCLTAADAAAQRLFRSTAPVEVTFTTSLKKLVGERDSTRLNPYGALMTYKDSSGKEASLPVVLRARGHFRRQARNCYFPPIRWDAKRADVQGTLFQGLTRMKITTECRPGNADYQQYILAEYAVYRAYQVVSPLHFRTRLARITYKDSAKATPDVTSWAYFIEDDGEMARDNNMKVVDQKGALFEDLDQRQLMITTLFEYMVGNTDVSISGLHNIVLLRDSTGLAIHPVAYDFDFSGLVNTRYATPDPRLGIRRVTDRLHRGPCKPLDEWKPVFAYFQSKRAAIDSVYGTIPDLSPGRAKDARSYLDDFWKVIANDRDAKAEIVDRCQKLGM